tara:strand:+ start:1076 stop:1597 length:522 start_codon:yes stop_codon:yes gene_type:complete
MTDFYKHITCVICGGDGYEYEQVDDKREKRPCPCNQQAYAKHLATATSKPQTYREQVASGLIDEEMPSPSARQLANDGMAKVMDNVHGDNEAEAVELIYDQLTMLATLQPYALTSDDLRKRVEHLIPRLHSTNIIGSLFRRAKREKLIESTGDFVSSELPQSHGRPIRVWRKK